jgi:hypothetical protein
MREMRRVKGQDWAMNPVLKNVQYARFARFEQKYAHANSANSANSSEGGLRDASWRYWRYWHGHIPAEAIRCTVPYLRLRLLCPPAVLRVALPLPRPGGAAAE